MDENTIPDDIARIEARIEELNEAIDAAASWRWRPRSPSAPAAPGSC